MGASLNDWGSLVPYRVPRAAALACAALVLALVTSACSPANPTPQITPPPATSTPNATPTAQATESPTEAPTEARTPTPVITPAPTATPVPTPSPTPSGPACTGSAGNLAFLSQAAKIVKFTVYCASKLASRWGFSQNPLSNWAYNKSGGYVLLYYVYGKTSTRLEVCEGAYASGNCTGSTGNIGTAKFATMSGELDSTADGFAIYVATGTSYAYAIVGHNMSQATFVSIAANMLAVPKS